MLRSSAVILISFMFSASVHAQAPNPFNMSVTDIASTQPPTIPAPIRVDSLEFGLSGTVSERAAFALARGDRVSVIVTLREPKAPVGLVPDSSEAIDFRRNAIEEQTASTIVDAFGVNGFRRATNSNIPRGWQRSTQFPQAIITNEFVYTPSFVALLDANEIERLRATPTVLRIQENSTESHFLNESASAIGAPVIWEQGFEGMGGAIAVLDTGVELEHPMTGPSITASACFNMIVPGRSESLCPGGSSQLTDLSTGSVGDSCIELALDPSDGITGCSHGTHVASTAAGLTTTSPQGEISGVARRSNIVAVNVFARFGATDCDGQLRCVKSYVSDQIDALEWLYDNRSELGLSVVNMSLGGGRFFSACDDDPRSAIVGQLRAAGVAVVVSAGNSSYLDSVSSPACISQVITVGSTNSSDEMSGFSNSDELVDLVAPGSGIYAAYQSAEPLAGTCTLVAGASEPSAGGLCHGFQSKSGTSMAAPHVAGAFSLLREAHPNASVSDIEVALEASGVAVFDGRNGLTHRRLQIDAAFEYLASGGGSVGANNTISEAIGLQGLPVSAVGNSLQADKEAGEPNHAGRSGGASLWWHWTSPSDQVVTIDTRGSNFDTLLGVYAPGIVSGTPVSALSVVASNDDITSGVLQSSVTFRARQGFTYYIAVDGFAAARGDIVLSING